MCCYRHIRERREREEKEILNDTGGIGSLASSISKNRVASQEFVLLRISLQKLSTGFPCEKF